MARDSLLSPRAEAALVLVLSSAWPVLSFMEAGRGEGLNYPRLGIYFFVLVAIQTATFGIFHLILRRTQWTRALYLSSFAIIYFCAFYSVTDGVRQLLVPLGISGGLLASYVLIFLAAGAVAWLLLKFRVVRVWALVFLGGAVGASIAATALQMNKEMRASSTSAKADAEGAVIAEKRNLYHLVTDMYPRQDNLLKYFGWDNEPFLQALGERGFFVARESFANYPFTDLSVAAVLEMDYPTTPEAPATLNRSRARQIHGGANRLVRTLKANGYAYVYVDNGFTEEFKCGAGVNQCIEGESWLRQQDIVFWTKTPMPVLVDLVAPDVLRKRKQPASQQVGLEQVIESLPFQVSPPYYLFAHVEMPHPPFKYDENCQFRPESDFETWLQLLKDKDKIRRLVPIQLKCGNRLLLQLIDRIYETDRDPVIFIHGDHGTALQNQFREGENPGYTRVEQLHEWSEDQRVERMAIFNAVRLPERCRGALYPSISPVNVMRVALACLERKPAALLPDRRFLSLYAEDADGRWPAIEWE